MTTAEELAALKSARNRGVMEVGHGAKKVKFQSLADMNATIARLERELAATRPAVSGLAATRRGF